MTMAGPCFWREPFNLVQDCGEDPQPSDWMLTFNNGMVEAEEASELPGFAVGTDFLLKIEGDVDGRTLEMRYRIDSDRYAPYYMGELDRPEFRRHSVAALRVAPLKLYR